MNKLTWFQGDNMEHGMHPLNLQGVGITPYVQPRLDLSMLGFPNDIYQVMAAAALQDMRSINPSRQASSPHLQFQQPQIVPSSTSFVQDPVWPHSQPQQSSLQNVQVSQPQLQAEATSQSQLQSLLEQQLQHSGMLRNQQSEQQPQLQHQMVDHQPIPNLVSSMSQFASASLPMAPLSQTFPSLSHQPHVSDPTENPASNTVNSSAAFCSPLEDLSSNLLNVTKNDSLISSAAWVHKKARVESPLSAEPLQRTLPQVELISPPLPNNSEEAFALPPFPGRDCAFDTDETTGVQNNLMFGVDVDSSSLLMQSRPGIGDDGHLPFSFSNITGSSPADYTIHSVVTASNCTNGSELMHSPDKTGNEPPIRNFVKVS